MGCVQSSIASNNQDYSANNRMRYGYAETVKESRKSFTPLLEKLKRINTLPEQATSSPRVLTVACGFAEDVPLYREILNAGRITAIDSVARFHETQLLEAGKDSHFHERDARRLGLAPEFDLITMRHPEPSSNKKIWQEIFVEVSLLAKRSNAVLLLTTFSQHERDFFIDLSKIMGSRGAGLVESHISNAAKAEPDTEGHLFGRDRYVAVFSPQTA